YGWLDAIAQSGHRGSRIRLIANMGRANEESAQDNLAYTGNRDNKHIGITGSFYRLLSRIVVRPSWPGIKRRLWIGPPFYCIALTRYRNSYGTFWCCPIYRVFIGRTGSHHFWGTARYQ